MNFLNAIYELIENLMKVIVNALRPF